VVEHLGCFHNLAIVNSAAINMGVQVRQIILETLSQKYLTQKGLVEWLKV
jgi:hypothetical protein